MSHFRTLIISILLLVAFSVQADLPFRQHRFDHLCQLRADTNAILFVGNSITDMHNWSESFAHVEKPLYLCNRGVSGALSQEVLDHIPQLVACQPRKLFLMIGTNDLGSNLTPQHVADNVARIIATIHRCSPRTEIYIQSILPSVVGTRTLDAEQQANALLRHIADTAHATYIDLWQPLHDIPTNTALSLDGLHLTAAGYHLWAQTIAPYLGTNCRSTYPYNAAETQRFGSLWGSNAMRASYFSVNDIGAQNILFFGDEMVKCGEWNELLHDPYFLNRGTGWGYDGTAPSIATTASLLSACRNGAPRAILLYTGTGDINTHTPIDTVRQHYLRLVAQMLRKYPCTPLYLVSLMPTQQPNERIAIFNNLTRQLCHAQSNLHYIDIHSALSIADTANPLYFQGNYLNGRGYQLVAQTIERHLYPERNADYRVLRTLQDNRTPAWNRHWVTVSNTLVLSPVPAATLWVADLTTTDHRYRYPATEATLSLGLTAATTMGLKSIIARPRPWVDHRNNLQCLQHVGSYSFPSGHTSFTFSTATTLTLLYPKWYVAVPAYLWAGAVGFSRLYIGAHYPSDVIAGAALGAGCAILAHVLTPYIVKDSPLPPDAAMLPPVTIGF